jgi:hypothetical protein
MNELSEYLIETSNKINDFADKLKKKANIKKIIDKFINMLSDVVYVKEIFQYLDTYERKVVEKSSDEHYSDYASYTSVCTFYFNNKLCNIKEIYIKEISCSDHNGAVSDMDFENEFNAILSNCSITIYKEDLDRIYIEYFKKENYSYYDYESRSFVTEKNNHPIDNFYDYIKSKYVEVIRHDTDDESKDESKDELNSDNNLKEEEKIDDTMELKFVISLLEKFLKCNYEDESFLIYEDV